MPRPPWVTPAVPGVDQPPLNFASPIGAICSWGMEAGSYGAAPAGGDSWSGTFNGGLNRARFIPFTLNEAVTIDGVGWYNGTTVNGNVDVGVYDVQGNLIVSAGSTAQATISVVQTIAITVTTLSSGNYFLAASQDSATGQLHGINMSAQVQEFLGVKQMAAAFPLPALATFASPSVASYPLLSAFTATVF